MPDTDDRAALDQAVAHALARGDTLTLSTLYYRFGLRQLHQGDSGSGYFFITQAYVLALVSGDEALSTEAYSLLKRAGREA